MAAKPVLCPPVSLLRQPHVTELSPNVRRCATPSLCYSAAHRTFAVGLFHPELGLVTTGQWGLVVTQTIGITAILLITVAFVLPAAMLLNSVDYLRVHYEEEARGLDYKFGNAASTYIMNKNQRLRACFLTLDAYGCSINDTISALKMLRNIIVLPFSPQASTNTIEAQVADVLSRFDLNPTLTKKYLAFLSHHKADAGDAARIFVDTAHRLVDRPPEELEQTLEPEVTDARASKRRSSAGLSELLQQDGARKIFLDSNDLTNLSKLIGHVEDSANHLLMLSRATLERPYVLCELVYAWKQRKKIVVVRVNWPGDDVDDASGRSFGFPQHLNEAIADWEDVTQSRETRTRPKGVRWVGWGWDTCVQGHRRFPA